MAIKTIDEFVRETLHERMRLAALDIGRAVRPVFSATDRGRPEHLGSCILLKYQSRHLLLTAAHVIDANKVSSLYIPIQGKLLQKLTGAGILTVAPSGIRDRDEFDFSIVELCPKLVDALGPVRYVGEHELQTEAIKGRAYMAFGYPNSQNKRIDHHNRKIVSKRFSYGGPLHIPDEKDSRSSASGGHLLRMKYERQSRTLEGSVVNSIAPKGISGGGLFDLGRIDVLSSSSTSTSRLAGVLIERRRKEKTIVATGIATVLGAL